MSEKVTLKKAVELLNQEHEWDPVENGKDIYSIKTLYNAISDGRLTAYGPRHARKVEVTQLLRVFGNKKAS